MKRKGIILGLFAALTYAAAEEPMSDLQKPPAKPPAGAPQLAPFQADSRRAWAKERTAILQKWQTYLGTSFRAGLFPHKHAPLKTQILATEELPTFTRQFVRYQVEDDVWTDGYLLVPKNRKGKLPAVVVFHATTPAQARQPAGLEPATQHGEADGTAKPELAIGVQLADRGYVALCPRCFIFGEGTDYAGLVSKMQARHPDWKGMTRMTFDAVRAVDYLESLPSVDKKRIGCTGHSLGAKEALYAAAFDERYKVAVFSEGGIGIGFSNWDAVWYLGDGVHQKDFALEHHQLLALIAPRPFLLLAGESADNDKSWAFIETALPVYKLLGAPDAIGWLNHREGHRYSPMARATAEAFLDRYLK